MCSVNGFTSIVYCELPIRNIAFFGPSDMNSRPADIRGAINAIATTTLDASKKKAKTDPPPNKRAKTAKKPVIKETESSEEEVYHFIGYVPAFGKVWELDGLKSGPLEVGEISKDSEWMDVVRPALRTKMRKYGHIQFSLLAIVDGAFEKASDEWEYWKRDRRALERHLDDGWRDSVRSLVECIARATDIFTRVGAAGAGRTVSEAL